MDALPQHLAHAVEAVPRLALTQVSKSIEGVRVVHDVTFAVGPAESVVLLGPSGCGKTTILRMIAGFLHPDAGEIWLDGGRASGPGIAVPTEKRRLGMVFQNYAVWPHKSVADNVSYGLAVGGMRRAEIRSRLPGLLASVRLDGLGGRFPHQLSGGQQQRVALARAIATEPSLLLLDEPLSNLDASLRAEMRRELKALHARSGAAMLTVTHDQEEALTLADRIVVLRAGSVEQVGSPDEIYRRPRNRFVAAFIGHTNLFEGRVDATDHDRGRIRLQATCGVSIWAQAHPETLAVLPQGSPAAVSIRPEDIEVVAAGSDPGAVPARLVDAAFLGSRYDLLLDVAGTPCRVDARSLDAFVDGWAAVRLASATAWAVP